MKTKILLTSLGTLLIVGTLAGCNKEGNSSDTKMPAAPEAAEPAEPAPSADTVPPAAGAATSQAATIATNAAAAMTETMSAAKAKADMIIAQAKSFITDKKYNEALEALNKLSSMALTPEQQKTVDDLKAQVQKLISSGTGAMDATKGLLGK